MAPVQFAKRMKRLYYSGSLRPTTSGACSQCDDSNLALANRLFSCLFDGVIRNGSGKDAALAAGSFPLVRAHILNNCTRAQAVLCNPNPPLLQVRPDLLVLDAVKAVLFQQNFQ